MKMGSGGKEYASEDDFLASLVNGTDNDFRDASRANDLLATAFQAHSGERLRCRFKIVNISFYANIRPLLTNHCNTKPEPIFMRLRQPGCYVSADSGEGVRDVRGSASMTERLF